MKVTICTKALYERYGGDVSCGFIEVDDDYYDLYLCQRAALACMDGEVCEVVKHDNGKYTLFNTDGEAGVMFTLTDEEFEVATEGMTSWEECQEHDAHERDDCEFALWRGQRNDDGKEIGYCLEHGDDVMRETCDTCSKWSRL